MNSSTSTMAARVLSLCSMVLVGSSLLVENIALGQDECIFRRGEIHDLGDPTVVDTNDAVDLLAYLFLGVSVPDCEAAADINDNGLVEPSDYTYLINYLHNDGPPPPEPFAERGPDPTPGVTVPDERDERFSLSIGRGAGVPSQSGIAMEIRLSNSDPISGIQVVLGYNQTDETCPDLLIQEIRTEEDTLLSAASAEYIIAEYGNVEGVAYIAALKDFATPFWFHVGDDPLIPAGEDQLLGTVVLAVSSCANMGFSPIRFVDGVNFPNDNVTPEVPLPEGHNLIVLGDGVVRPVLGEEGGVEIRRGFIRGDANKDDGVDLADAIFILYYQFNGGAEPPCFDAADTNNDTRINIADAIWLLNYLFLGGPQPSEPFPQAGVDPSDDGSGSLGCESDLRTSNP